MRCSAVPQNSSRVHCYWENIMKKNTLTLLPLLAAMSTLSSAFAADGHDMHLPEVSVKAGTESQPVAMRNDMAQTLTHNPGYGVAVGGGISGLPILNGMASDRLNVRFDGMEITAACANFMNGPLSYIHPSQVGMVEMIAGIAAVSRGGDNIGGVIDVKSKSPVFAASDTLYKAGRIALTARSNNREFAQSVQATIASQSLSLSVEGTHAKAKSYRDGHGDKVLGSLYSSNNQSVTLAAKGDGQQFTVRAGQQRVPYQGFPNQYMDMTDNRGQYVNAEYVRNTGWGEFSSKVYWQDTKHDMGFFTAERPGTMPMNTHGKNLGYEIKASIHLNATNILRVGHELHTFKLNDYWPAVAGSMMMGPNTYLNVHNGTRQRLAFFGEWEHHLDQNMRTIIGVRHERVRTDTGDVQAYGSGMMNMTDANAAAAFNAQDRKRHDNNVDVTALMEYDASATTSYELGLARKNRSPNLYERYAWGRGTMSMTMTNWFGDGNGYVGNSHLKPETAYSLSGTVDWHDDNDQWNVRLTPYFTYVKDYIDADVIGTFHPYQVAGAHGNLLQFANHDARLYGINMTWLLPLIQESDFGNIDLSGKASITRGKRTDGERLYRMMPLTASVKLAQHYGRWHNEVETVLMSRKTRVSQPRLEQKTGGYTLMNVRSTYQISPSVQISAGITNLLNKYYGDSLGGVYLSGLANTKTGGLETLPGYGRSVDIGLSVDF